MDNAQIDIISVVTRPTVPIVFTVTSLVMGYVNMESDEFLCRRAVLPPDSFVVFSATCKRVPRNFLRI